jgi:cation transporter-like permease
VLLAIAALWTLQAAVEWVAVAEGGMAYSTAGHLFTSTTTAGGAQPSSRGPSAVLDAALLVLLNGTLAVGCALLLARNRTGAGIVFACCVVKLAMTIASWNVGPSLLTSTAAMSRGGGPGALALIYHWTTILTFQATSLLWPALVLAILTYRAPEDPDAAALPPPLPAPSPLPPPRRPNW